MKLAVIKKSITFFICFLLSFAFVPHIQTFASFNELMTFYHSGGFYQGVQMAKNDYLSDHPEDKTEYECHYLMPQEALNEWGRYIRRVRAENHRSTVTISNAFLVNDPQQNWAPAIIMEKADHEKTISHYDSSSTLKKQHLAKQYICRQAQELIFRGDVVGVVMNEINSIRKTFGNKYDIAIGKALQYVQSLRIRSLDTYTLVMDNPYDPLWFFKYSFEG